MAKAKQSRRGREMSPVHTHAAAVDIGATLHVAAVGPGCDPEPVRSFGTLTADLHRMADWFERCGVKTVAMESTGVYWIPAYEVLEQRRRVAGIRDAGVVAPAPSGVRRGGRSSGARTPACG